MQAAHAGGGVPGVRKNPTLRLLFADLGPRREALGLLRIELHDIADRQVLGGHLTDTADVGFVAGIERGERRRVERLVRAREGSGRTGAHPGVGRGGHGVLGELDAAERVAEAVAIDDR